MAHIISSCRPYLYKFSSRDIAVYILAHSSLGLLLQVAFIAVRRSVHGPSTGDLELRKSLTPHSDIEKYSNSQTKLQKAFGKHLLDTLQIAT